MFWADFHIHSTFSDGRLSIPEIVDLYGRYGFGAIAITDHVCATDGLIGRASRYLDLTLTRATFSLYKEIIASEARRARLLYNMTVISGIEISKNAVTSDNSAHILALGIKDLIPADLDVATILGEIRSQQGLSIAAHPVDTGKMEKQTYYLWNNRHTLADKIDAWEVGSGKNLLVPVFNSPYAKVANGDFHSTKHLESWKTIIHADRNEASVFKALRLGHVSFGYFKPEDYHDFYRDDSRLGDGSFFGGSRGLVNARPDS